MITGSGQYAIGFILIFTLYFILATLWCSLGKKNVSRPRSPAKLYGSGDLSPSFPSSSTFRAFLHTGSPKPMVMKNYQRIKNLKNKIWLCRNNTVWPLQSSYCAWRIPETTMCLQEKTVWKIIYLDSLSMFSEYVHSDNCFVKFWIERLNYLIIQVLLENKSKQEYLRTK